MEISDLYPYLVVLGVVLLDYYLRHRKASRKKQLTGQPSDFPAEATPFLHTTSTPSTSVPEDAAVRRPAYRALAESQRASVSWQSQKGGLERADYRTQFKTSNALRQAVVSAVVLGSCLSEDSHQGSTKYMRK